MKKFREMLASHAKKNGVRLGVVEQDYLLSWILAAFAKSDLKNTLIFKGGTALKKCYFGDYRFSEDLDFSAINGAPENKGLENTWSEISNTAEKAMSELADIKLFFTRYREKSKHPHRQEAFVIRAQYPWQREPLTKIMVEVTYAEKIVTRPKTMTLLHTYEQIPEGDVTVYSIEEVIIEKLRAMLENAKKIHERGWARSRVRDYYDLYSINDVYNDRINWSEVSKHLESKCAHKSIYYESIENFFDEQVIEDAKNQWGMWLDHLTQRPLEFSDVLAKLKRVMADKFTLA